MSEKTLSDAAKEYIEHLKKHGKSERTAESYARDLEQIQAFFGADRKLTAILPPHICAFLRSDELQKVDGKQRADVTRRRIVRVLRMLLVWAVQQRYIARLPLPRHFPMGRDGSEVTNAANPAAIASR
ncbi:MAG: site-specific integrase [Armatimonadota bacterium]|nr:site-specific integrase [bacterium]